MTHYAEKHHPAEFKVAKRLIAEILKRGFFVRLQDECEVSVSSTKDIEKVLPELCATGFDYVEVRAPNYGKLETIASFMLVWGNDPDGSELIADYTDSPLADEIYNLANGCPLTTADMEGLERNHP